jgi:hypothetical protein
MIIPICIYLLLGFLGKTILPGMNLPDIGGKPIPDIPDFSFSAQASPDFFFRFNTYNWYY